MLELVVVGTADRASKYDEKEKKKPIRLVAISYFPPLCPRSPSTYDSETNSKLCTKKKKKKNRTKAPRSVL